MTHRIVIAGILLALLGGGPWSPPAAGAQMSPEEAMKGLGGDEAEDGEARDSPGPEMSHKFRVYGSRVSRFFFEVDGEVHCNTYFHRRFSRLCRRATDEPRLKTLKTLDIPVGVFLDTSLDRRRAITEPYKYQLDEEEVFARQQAIGEPEPGNFGFIVSAVVDEVVDGDTVVLREVRIVEDDAKAAYDKLRREERFWAAERYRELAAKAWSYRRRIAAEDRFYSRYPDEDELVDLREQVIEYMYEGRLEMIEVQDEWDGVTVTLHGVGTARLEEGETWEKPSTPLILTRREGRQLHAVTPTVARRSIDLAGLLTLAEGVGYSEKQFIALAEAVQERRVDNHSAWRRLALILAGRPIEGDGIIAAKVREQGGQ